MTSAPDSANDSRLALTGLALGFGFYAASLALCFAFPGDATPLEALQLGAITPVAFAIIIALGGPVAFLRLKQQEAGYVTTWIRIKYLFPATYRSFRNFA